MAVQEVQWSDLARDPTRVAELTDKGDVRVKRRDGADLLLTREDRVASVDEGILTTARTLRRTFELAPEAVEKILLGEYPWLDQLPKDALTEFAADFVRASQAAADLGRWEVLAQTVREWKATAAIYADPALVDQLTRPIDDVSEFMPAPPPVMTED
jgi:hypothetical protein